MFRLIQNFKQDDLDLCLTYPIQQWISFQGDDFLDRWETNPKVDSIMMICHVDSVYSMLGRDDSW